MTHSTFGCLPDRPDARDFRYDVDRMSLSATHNHTTCLREVAPVQDQGPTNSCVAHGVLGAEHDYQLRHGKALVLRSRLFVYHNARWISKIGRGGTPRIEDTGTYIRAMAKGIYHYGFCDEKKYRYDVTRINLRPSWGPRMAAVGHAKVNYYRILDRGSARLKAVDAALEQGHSVVFGQTVWTDFVGDVGPHIIDLPPNSVDLWGGHCMRLTGYKSTNDGKLYRVTNSWGIRWREGGHVWYTEDMVGSGIRDLTVIKWNV